MKKNLIRVTAACTALAFMAGCSSTTQQPQATNTTTAPAQPEVVKGVGLEMTNLDTTVAPCVDFYQYANGGWLKNNPVPASESRWGSFSELIERNNKVLRRILQEAASEQSAAEGTPTQKVGDFYASGMDSAAIEKAGIAPIQAELQRINQISDKKGVLQQLVRLQQLGANPLFNAFVGQDEKNSTQYILYLYQGGLGMPDRDYYLKDDARSVQARKDYQAHLQNMFQLLGDKEAAAKQNAANVLALETALAKASKSRVDLRDPHANYNKMTVAELQKLAPGMQWNMMLQQAGATEVKNVVVGQPEFFKAVNGLVASQPLSIWKTYLRWNLARMASPYLSEPFVKENFNFYGTALTGAKEMQPRWKRVLRTVDHSIGEALGRLYVEETFSPEAKQKAMEMVQNLQLAFKEHVSKLEWMSEETKEQAMSKLDAFMVKIGYPDKWKNYEGLAIDRSSFAGNVMRANQFAYAENIAKIGKEVDRAEWFMSPPTVNAYYNPSLNEIVFPAGILQPPFFDPKADDAVNYGGMGAVIGHELTHGFDDQGSKYDAEGNLKDWWTEEDNNKFVQLADQVVKQYDQYTVLDALHVNGKLTLGENIADLGGLNIAYTALQRALEQNNPGKLDGFTPEQRFFLAWAQIWRINATEQAQNQQILVDPHSPGRFRTNGPLSNMPEFYKAFGCEPGDPMYRPTEQRVNIW